MGQYYLIANMEKKEKLVIGGSEPGRKLMEFAAKIPVINAVTNLMADRWKGDHVYVVGDYADLDDEKDTYFKALRKWTDKLHLTEFLYGYIDDNFTSFEGDTEEKNYRFIYNHDRKEYIDVFHCPEHESCMNSYISPLILLIAMGNGKGGGDYFGKNEKLVGTWCDSVASLEITKEPLDELGYEEIHPDFEEQY